MKYIALSDEQYKTLVAENNSFNYIQEGLQLTQQAMWANRMNALLNFIFEDRTPGFSAEVLDEQGLLRREGITE